MLAGGIIGRSFMIHRFLTVLLKTSITPAIASGPAAVCPETFPINTVDYFTFIWYNHFIKLNFWGGHI